ncbi:unnamed protein product [Symbiodinium sp. CCMP2592]|nr:unnamed protein product [Symbiodinium sp. CCMP2592]
MAPMKAMKKKADVAQAPAMKAMKVVGSSLGLPPQQRHPQLRRGAGVSAVAGITIAQKPTWLGTGPCLKRCTLLQALPHCGDDRRAKTHFLPWLQRGRACGHRHLQGFGIRGAMRAGKRQMTIM